jgi:hypothetical protein
VSEGEVFNEGAVEDSAGGAEVVVVVIAEEGVVGVAVVAVAEDEVVPTQSSSLTDIRACSSQKAKTTCW